MRFIYCLILVLASALQSLEALSGNILAGQPSVQSSTHNDYFSQNANDGNSGTVSATDEQSNPYWQADLEGFFNVTKITVKSSWGSWAVGLKDAIIEVSTTSVTTCPELGTTVTCGRWADADLRGVSVTFTCSLTTAVRYVRIWREVTGYLVIAEVEAEGVPSIPSGQLYYDRIKSEKVTTAIKSLSVAHVTECGKMCYRTQPCLAFSFSKDKKPNCLLATDTSMAPASEWIGYRVKECIKMPTTCSPIG